MLNLVEDYLKRMGYVGTLNALEKDKDPNLSQTKSTPLMLSEIQDKQNALILSSGMLVGNRERILTSENLLPN